MVLGPVRSDGRGSTTFFFSALHANAPRAITIEKTPSRCAARRIRKGPTLGGPQHQQCDFRRNTETHRRARGAETGADEKMASPALDETTTSLARQAR